MREDEGDGNQRWVGHAPCTILNASGRRGARPRTPPSDVPARAAGRKQPTPCSLKSAVLFRRIILNLVLCYIKWILLMMLKSLVYLVAYRKDAL